jgi:hypothetical protein
VVEFRKVEEEGGGGEASLEKERSLPLGIEKGRVVLILSQSPLPQTIK